MHTEKRAQTAALTTLDRPRRWRRRCRCCRMMGFSQMETPLEQVTKTCALLGIKPAERILVVRLSSQTLQFYRGNTLVRSYPVSTSRRPPSNIKDSLGTPRGL